MMDAFSISDEGRCICGTKVFRHHETYLHFTPSFFSQQNFSDIVSLTTVA